MNCRRIQKKLTAYQDGELGAREKEQVAAHLRCCPHCRHIYAEMEEAWGSLDSVHEMEASPDFYHRLSRKILAQDNRYRPRRFTWLWPKLLSPAGTCALILCGLVLGGLLGDAVFTVQVWPDNRRQHVYSQAINDPDALKVFASIPPGSLGGRVFTHGQFHGGSCKMKSKFLYFALVLSLAVNLAVMATVGYHYYRNVCVAPAAPCPLNQSGRHLYESLGLSERQLAAITPLSQPFHARLADLDSQIATKRNYLIDLLGKAETDRGGIETTRKEIAALQDEIQRDVILHITQIGAILDPDQKKRFMDMLRAGMAGTRLNSAFPIPGGHQ